MATIADKLTTIAGIKTDIRTAINGKGGSLTSGSPFSAYSAAISSLPSGGGGGASAPDWSEIGYTGVPQEISDGFSHAKTIYDNWDPTVTNLENKFSGDMNLVYMPMVETSGVTNMKNMFSGCTNLAVVPQLNTSSVNNMYYAFFSCSRLTSVPQLNTSSVTDMRGMFCRCSETTSIPQFNTSACTRMDNLFQNCTGLTSVPALDSRQVTSMDSMVDGCKSLQKINSLDMDKCTDFRAMFGYSTMPNLRFMLLKGLGTPSGVTSYENARMVSCTNWGVDSTDIPDARQSLVDSLLTYSFDRATAGYSTCTIKLHSNSYNQLTAQEIADIQAKGYNITR